MPIRLGLDVRLTYYTSGGIAKYIRRLAARLPALDPAGQFIYLYRRGHADTLSAQAGRVDCRTPAHHRLESLALSLEVWPLHLDLLHSPDFIPPLFGIRRSVITVHDLAFLLYPQFLTTESRRYYNGQIRRAVRQADAIITVSQATRADLIDRLAVPSDKITVIQHGADPEFQPLPDEVIAPVLTRFGLTPGYLLFVGTFEPRKNVAGLLAAYALLRRRSADAPPLVLAGGKGWLFESTAARVHELQLEAEVHFIENFSAAEAPALYNGASLFVWPSYYEGFGFPVLEALGCGLPTIISDRTALTEVAGDAAVQINPDDTEALAEALYRVLTDSALRERMRQRGLLRCRKFSWEKAARETFAVYQRVLSR
jgi:glycosyltransferase involved in cell wall biosynthesis